MLDRRILELESVRGLAAMCVILLHFFAWNPFLEIPIIQNSTLMVELFFVLSGLVIFNAYAHKLETPKDVFNFQLLRLGRLYPVHILFLFLYLLREIFKLMFEGPIGVQDIRVSAFGENTLQAFFEHIFLLQAVLPTGNAYTFNIPAWSISVEFYTYFLFALVVLYCGQKKIWIFGLLALLSLIILSTHQAFGFEWFVRCIAGFFLGCLLANALKKIKLRVSRYASLTALASLFLFLHFKPTDQWNVLIYFFSMFLIATLILAPNGYLNNVLKLRPLIWLGEMSFSIYMSHYFVLFLVTNYFKRILKYPDVLNVTGVWVPSFSTFTSVCALILFLLITILVAEFVHIFLEVPVRRKVRDYINGEASNRKKTEVLKEFKRAWI